MKKILASLFIIVGLTACNEATVDNNPDVNPTPQKFLEQLLEEGITVTLDQEYFAKSWDVQVIDLAALEQDDSVYTVSLPSSGDFNVLNAYPLFTLQTSTYSYDQDKVDTLQNYTLAPNGETVFDNLGGLIKNVDGFGGIHEVSTRWDIVETALDVNFRIIHEGTAYPICEGSQAGDCADKVDNPEFDAFDYVKIYPFPVLGADQVAWASKVGNVHLLFTSN